MLTSWAWTLHAIAYLIAKALVPVLDEHGPPPLDTDASFLPPDVIFQCFLEFFYDRINQEIRGEAVPVTSIMHAGGVAPADVVAPADSLAALDPFVVLPDGNRRVVQPFGVLKRFPHRRICEETGRLFHELACRREQQAVQREVRVKQQQLLLQQQQQMMWQQQQAVRQKAAKSSATGRRGGLPSTSANVDVEKWKPEKAGKSETGSKRERIVEKRSKKKIGRGENAGDPLTVGGFASVYMQQKGEKCTRDYLERHLGGSPSPVGGGGPSSVGIRAGSGVEDAEARSGGEGVSRVRSSGAAWADVEPEWDWQ